MHITKSDFFKLNFLQSDQWKWWSCRRSDFNSVWVRLPCCLSKATLKWYFLNIYLTTFLKVRNFGNTLAMSAIFFFSICSKFNLDFKNAKKNSEKFFCFWDNCIWVGCLKHSLLKTEDMPRAVNVLTNSLKSFRINKRHFFKLNCFTSYQ